MSAFLLLFAIGAAGLVIFWYVFDEATRDGDGKSGVLGMTDRPHGVTGAQPTKSNWKVKPSGRPWRIRRH